MNMPLYLHTCLSREPKPTNKFTRKITHLYVAVVLAIDLCLQCVDVCVTRVSVH